MEAVLQAAEHPSAEPAEALPQLPSGEARAAHDSPRSQSAQAASAAGDADTARQRGSRTGAAQPGSVPVGPGAHAAAALSLEGQPPSSEPGTGGVGAEGSPPVATSASNPMAEQTFSVESSPLMPCSSAAVGTAAAVDSAGQPPPRKAVRQPAEAGRTPRKASSSTHIANAGRQQAAHDSQTPDVAQVYSCGLMHLTPTCHPLTAVLPFTV